MWGDKASGEIVAPIVPSPKILEIKPKFQVGLLKIFIYTDAFMSYIACIQTGGSKEGFALYLHHNVSFRTSTKPREIIFR